MMKRVTSIILILAMIITLCSFAFADEELITASENTLIEAIEETIIAAEEETEEATEETEAIEETVIAAEEEKPIVAEATAEEAVEAITETEEIAETEEKPVAAATMPVRIISQPCDVYVEVGTRIAFTVVAENVVSYQWMYSRNNGGSWRNTSFSGNQTASLSMTAKEDYYAFIWKCRLTDADGKITETGTVQIKLPVVEEESVESANEKVLVIKSQPADTCKELGEKVVFTVVAENAVSYQWKYSRDNGASWRTTTLTGNKTASLSFRAKADYYNYIWKCVLTDEKGNTFETEAVRVTKAAEPEVFEILVQPVDTEVAEGDRVSLTVVATGVVSYQWIYNRNNGTAWRATTLSGCKTASLTLTGKDAYYTYTWKCILTDAQGNTLESDAVRIIEPIVILPVTITAQPKSTSAVEGQKATFAVEAENAVSYSWMTSSDNGTTWTAINGAEANVLVISVDSNAYNKLYKCVMADEAGETVDTDVVTVKAPEASKLIVVNAAPAPASAAIGETIVITAAASGVETYEWLSSEKGAGWTKAEEAGSETANLSVTVTEKTFTMQYKCVMVDVNGDVAVTEPVGIEAASDELKIVSQPVSVTKACGDVAVFTVKARNAAAYQWQVNHDNQWLDITELSGCTGESLSVQVITNRSTLKYRCRVTGIAGEVITTNTVSISILDQDITVKGDEVILYDVPLYYQGRYNLCWDYSQQMVEDFTLGITHTDAEVDELCKDRAVEEYGSAWNNGGLPTDESWDVIWDDEITMEKVYEKLVENGPLYVNYNNYSMGHMVVLTGMDLSTGTMYTNNPWRVEGTQSYDEFLDMFAVGNHKVSYSLPLIYVSWAEWQ